MRGPDRSSYWPAAARSLSVRIRKRKVRSTCSPRSPAASVAAGDNAGKNPFDRHHALADFLENGATRSVAFFADLGDFQFHGTEAKTVEHGHVGRSPDRGR